MDIEFGIKLGTTFTFYDTEVYSIQCPSDWQATNPPSTQVYMVPEVPKNQADPFPNAFTIQYSPQAGILAAGECEKLEKMLNPKGVLKAIKKISFAQRPAEVFEMAYIFNTSEGAKEAVLKSIYFQVPKNDFKLIRISYWYEKPKEGKYKALMEKMLETFKLK